MDPELRRACQNIEFGFRGPSLVVTSDDGCGYALGFGANAQIAGTYTWHQAE